MDYLNYGKKVQEQSQKPQPQGFIDIKNRFASEQQQQKPQPQGFGQQKVQLTQDDFSFGDLNQQTTQPQNYQQLASPPPPKNQRELLQLFPTPLSISPIPFNYEKELEWIKKDKFNKHNYDGSDQYNCFNKQSENTFILDSPELKRIRLWIESEIKVFSKEVLGGKTELVITQSWLNRNLKGESHHDHMHPNSIISGVWYPLCNEKLPPIKFMNRHQPQISLGVEKYNTFNSATFMLPMQMGELIIFPSHLMHGVPQNQSDDARISLSFNTWGKGSVGDQVALTYLPLERCV